MKKMMTRLLALAGVVVLGLIPVRAQDEALLNALVKKGVLSDQEAENIRASVSKENSESPSSRISISNSISNLKLYGDARLRYEYIDDTAKQNPVVGSAGTVQSQGSNIQERYRYRIRIGADYTYSDHLTAGFELESATASDSANQSFGDEYSKAPINVGLVYLQWKPFDWLTLVGGKQRQPLYTTDLTWDPDINPEGGSEAVSFTFPIGGGGEEAPMSGGMHDMKDMKDSKMAMAPMHEPSEMSLQIGFTAAQFIYNDNNEFTAQTSTGPGFGLVNNTDVWQFVEQVPVQFNFNKSTFVKIAPGFDSYTSGGNNPGNVVGDGYVSGAGLAGAAAPGAAAAPAAVVGSGNVAGFNGPAASDHLEILQAPGEFDIKLAKIPFKLYWDFDLNLDGKQRVQNIYLGNGQEGVIQDSAATPNLAQRENHGLGNNIAWLAGIQAGQNKKKGDWMLRGDFRQVGLGAIDPNENDSDWGSSYLDQQGFKIQGAYNFTDFLTGYVTYYNTWALDDVLQNQALGTVPIGGAGGYSTSNTATSGGAGATGASSLSTIAGARSTQRVQVDLQWKF